MPFALPKLRIGAPIQSGELSVFPLFAKLTKRIEYVLSDDALENGSVCVEEVSQSGSIPDVLICNRGKQSVLFIEGDELVGANQNRILNATVMVAAGKRLTVPVSCVEKGRWARATQCFQPSGNRSPTRLRHLVAKSIADSLLQGRGLRSDQAAVWKEIRSIHTTRRTVSRTEALADAYSAANEALAATRKRLGYVAGATGMAAAVGNKLLSLDLFDGTSTCRKVWGRLITGFAFDTFGAGENCATPVTGGDVERLLSEARQATWLSTPAVGDGAARRTQFNDTHGAALVVGGQIVHASLLPAA